MTDRGRGVLSALSGDRSRQVVTCVAAAAQVVVPTVWGPRFDREDGPPEVITPAPYTFSVWFPIFGLALWYAGYQARRVTREDAVLRRVGWPLAGAFAATGIWAPLVRTGRDWEAQLALVAIAVGAEVARERFATAEAGQRRSSAQLLAVAPVTGMLSAWGWRRRA